MYSWQLRGGPGGSGRRRNEASRNESCRRIAESCLTAKQRPVCASDGLTYSSKCEIRKLRRCDRKLIAFVSTGHCPIGKTNLFLLTVMSFLVFAARRIVRLSAADFRHLSTIFTYLLRSLLHVAYVILAPVYSFWGAIDMHFRPVMQKRFPK